MTRKPEPQELKRLALFGGISDEALARFASLADAVELPAGAEVYGEGEPARQLFILVQGRARVWKRCADTGAERELATLVPGDFFGEMSFVDMQPRSATVRTLEEVALWTWSYTTLSAMYRRDEKAYTLLVMNIARELSRRLRRADATLARVLPPPPPADVGH